VARTPKTPRWLQAARERPSSEKADWLARALARAGAGTLAEVERAIAERRVRVGGQVVTQPFFSLARGAKVELDGRAVDVAPRTRVLMFHKPRGLVTSARDPDGGGTVFDALLPALPERLRAFGWHAVGRLDRDTTGLLLFTNDERFVEHATSPKTHLPKRYLALVAAEVTPKQLSALEQGLVLNDGPTLPARARARGPREVELTLTEGRHHQVKRMLSKVGLPVLALHREAVGELSLDVEVGAAREVPPAEVEAKLGFAPRG
jgi:23S rRNA pseudouridine2605 synthase